MTWERRWHPLREEWVVVSGHRQDRPWSGERVVRSRHPVPRFDPECKFCPGNVRVGGVQNPDYATTLVFDNDLPVVGRAAPRDLEPTRGILRNAPATGVARVVCFTPRHALSFGELEHDAAVEVVGVLAAQYLELAADPAISHVLVFENRGEVVGVSNPHPHCQIYATSFVFKTIETEARLSQRHLAETGRVLMQDVLAAERADGRRIVFENDAAIAFVPYFARYPFELFVAPKATHANLAALTGDELRGFAAVLQRVLVKADNLWSMPFPYVLAYHQAPTDGGDHDGFHFHVELHPPLRRPDLLKYPAGPEIGGGNYMLDVAPEQTAAELRNATDAHYKAARGSAP